MDPLLVLACVPAVSLLKRRGWREFWCLAVVFSFLVHFLGAYISWKWETQPLWALIHHPVLFFLFGGSGYDAQTRLILTLSSVLVLALAAWAGLRWAGSFKPKPI